MDITVAKVIPSKQERQFLFALVMKGRHGMAVTTITTYRMTAISFGKHPQSLINPQPSNTAISLTRSNSGKTTIILLLVVLTTTTTTTIPMHLPLPPPICSISQTNRTRRRQKDRLRSKGYNERLPLPPLCWRWYSAQ